jgi:tight adherence protein B
MFGLPATTLIPAALIFLAVAFGTVSMALLLDIIQERRRRSDALRQLRDFTNNPHGAEGPGLIRGLEGQVPEWLAPIAQRVPAFEDANLMLEQAGSSMSLSRFMVISAGLAVSFGLGILVLTNMWIAGIIAAIAGGLGPYVVFRRKRTRRFYKFEEQLPEAIDMLGRAIRAGHPLSAGLKMVSDEAAEPVAGEFRRTHEEHRFGLAFEDAMLAMADRVGIVDVRILVTAILIQREVGGNLAEVLDNLASVIRARFTIRRQLRVYTAQGRFSGYVLAVLPIAVGAAIYSLNPPYIKLLFTDPMGKLLVTLAVIFQIIGFLWIRKIVNIEI